MADKAQGAAVADRKQEAVALDAAAKRESVGLLGRFLVLKGASRELWIIFAVHLLGYVAYKLLNITWALWLTYDLGFSDESAGAWVAGWSALMTLSAVLVGSFTDAIGVRKALLIGLWVGIISRVILTFATAKWLVLGCGMIPVAVGEALGTPAMVAAVRRFSTTAQRTISFSIFYATMNVGIFLTNIISDHVRRSLGDRHTIVELPWLGIQLTTYRTLFLISVLFELSLIPLLYSIRRGVEATDEGIKITPEEPKYPGESLLKGLYLVIRDALRETVRIFAGLWSQPGFYKFLAFLTFAAFVRLIFVQMDYVFPKFGIRELGAGVPTGHLYNINAALIIILVPIVGALSQKIAAYRMVTVGSAIAAASVFIMVLPPSWFQGLADGPLGHYVGHGYLGLTGSINPWYMMIFLFVVILSVGEAFYSPRLYEYAACIAPKGQEASYMALSYLPFFLAKLGVASFSGVLLSRYCPEAGPRNSATLWLIIAVVTAVCPVGLMVFRRWIRVPEAGREG